MTEYTCPTCTYGFIEHEVDKSRTRRGAWCYACNKQMVEPTAEEKVMKALTLSKKHGFSTVTIPVAVLEELFNFQKGGESIEEASRSPGFGG